MQNYDRGRGRRVYSKRMSNLLKRFEEGRQTDVESELDDQPMRWGEKIISFI